MAQPNSLRALRELLAADEGVLAVVGIEDGNPCVGTKRPPGGTEPYVLLRRIGGPTGGLSEQRGDKSDWPVFQIDIVAGTLADGETPDWETAETLEAAVLDALDATPAQVNSGERITCLSVRARRTVPGDPIPRARLLVEVECLVWAPAAD